MNTSVKIILFIFTILFGAFMFVFGGWDDSPGAQLLGVIIFAGGMVGIVKSRKNKV